MEDQVLEFQEILVQVQDCLSQTEVLELVFLCSDLLKKDLSNVVTARELFCLLQSHELLSSDDSSLLVELLRIIKRGKLVQNLQLNPQLSRTRVSAYRQLLYELSENIADDDLKNIKFLLNQTLPRKKLQPDMTILQLFLEMEKGDFMGAENLGTLERIIGRVSPSLQKKIKLYQMDNHVSVPEEGKCMDTTESQKNSIAISSVRPDITAGALASPEQLLPPSYFNSQQYTESSSQSATYSGDVLVRQVSRLRLSETQDLAQVDQNLNFREPNENITPEYKMSGDWRGFALIINNYDFSESVRDLKQREGTDVDEQHLDAVLQWLGFETVKRMDCSRNSMLSALDELCGRDHSEADCVVCCVMTHGYEGGLYGVDGLKVTVKELMTKLDSYHCPSLLQKPKLFFIQACQGSQEQRPVFLQSDGSRNTSVVELGIFSDAEVPRQSIPVGADYLVAMSTVPGYASFREKFKGTWFIQSLCKNLQCFVPSGVDLLAIMTQVNNEVSKKADPSGRRKQMPQPEFTLTKRVVFPIPKTPAPSQL